MLWHGENLLPKLRDRIQAADIVLEPWPHLPVSDIFPPDFYYHMLLNLPTSDKMEILGRGTPTRLMYWLVKNGEVAPSPLNQFWSEFRNLVVPELKLIIEEKFSVQSDGIDCEVIHDYPTYYIGPHTDTPRKLVTGIFYLPMTDVNAKHGTELYSCAEPDPAGRGHRFSDEYKYVKTIPYVPNTALFFRRTDISFHAVTATPVERWLLIFDLFGGKRKR